jgi:RNA polymerase sigma-70 factor, ECF subfamily
VTASRRHRRRGNDAGGPAGFHHVSRPVTGSTLTREAFRCYVEPEIEVLLRVAQTVTGSWADAEDVVQETLLRAWRAADRFDGQHPRAWLLTILRRAHLNSLRRQRPDLTGDTNDPGQQHPAFGAAVQPSPEDLVVDQMLTAVLEWALAALDPRYRTVLLLVDVDELTYAEAAEVLDIPLGTVMSRLSRARDKMRCQLRTAAPPDEGTP